MQLRKIISLALFGFFLIGRAEAQTPITLQDALKYALQNNEVVRQARLEIENARQKTAETRANVYPQIHLNSMVTNNLIVQQFVLPAEAFGGPPGEFMSIKAGQTWNAMSQVQLSQQIYNQQLFTGLKAAKSSAEYFELANRISEENVIQQVAVNFYQVLISHQKMEVIDANLNQVSRLEETAKTQFENGLVKKIDLDRIKVNKSNLQTQKLTLQNAVSQQENLLKYYMGMPVTEEIELLHESLENTEAPSALFLSKNVQVSALNVFKTLEKQEELLGLQKRAQRAEAFPILSLGANYTYNTQSGTFNLYTNKALSYDVAALTATLSVPIFDGNARRSRIKQTEIEIRKVQEEKRKTTNGLQMDLENARNQLLNNLEVIRSQEENKELAEEVFRSTQENYKNGLAPLTDLLNAETEWVAAQNSYHEALLNYKIAEINLTKAKGEINTLLNN